MRTTIFAVCLLMIAGLAVPPSAAESNHCVTSTSSVAVPSYRFLREPIFPGQVTQLAYAAEMNAKYRALSAVFSESELDYLDSLHSDVDMLDDPIWRNADFNAIFASHPLLATASVDASERTGSLQENGGASASLEKTVQRVTSGGTPTMYFLNYLREQNRHQDFWTFDVGVRAFNAACQEIGFAYEHFSYDDHRARTDIATHVMEFPLAHFTDNVEDIATAEVEGLVQVCHYGWFSGKAKGCSSSDLSGVVEFQHIE